MGTKADFYLGRGPQAEWLGSISWDGLPIGVADDIRNATTEEEYRRRVSTMLSRRVDAVVPAMGWPWPWDSSQETNYTYAFDQGAVWASCFGSSWWRAGAPEPDHTKLKRKAARLPDMSFHRKLSGKDKVLIVKE